jgi:phosphoenolpyruvate synthase/pyruvate phosphate dikinase
MSSYVLGFQEIDKTEFMGVGGKGANLGELARIEGIHVAVWCHAVIDSSPVSPLFRIVWVVE